MLRRQNEVIEDREADDGAGRDDDRDTTPHAQTRAMIGAEFGFEGFVDAEEAKTLRQQTRCVRRTGRRGFRGRHTRRVPGDETALYVFGSRGASRARINPGSGVNPYVLV